ncbi:MAG: 30S ribosomal protein S6 [Deltaproteobacteria bacterium]|nr:30S ribosomal protein S6 [Deltaproteobacteria bacterium]
MAEETTHYETLFIVHPVHSGKNKELCDRYLGVLEGRGATVTHFEEWGMRDLAYPIEKQGRGFYNLVQYQASAGTSEELERLMRLSDEVMRCMTVVLDEDVQSLARTDQPAPAPEPESAAAPETESAPAPESTAAPEPASAPAPESEPEPAPEPAEEPKEVQEGSEA